MPVSRSPSCAVLVALFLLACGGKSYGVREGDDDGGSTSQGGSGSSRAGSGSTLGGGGANAAGRGGSVGGQNTSGSASGGVGGDTCEGFDDEAGTLVNIELINKTSRTLYVGSREVTCGTTPLFYVKHELGNELTIIDDCRVPCESLRGNSPVGGCTGLCRFPSLLILNPGAIYETTWSGIDYVQKELPLECSPSGFGNVCQRAERIRPGSFIFMAQAGTKADCSNAPDCDYCPLSKDVCGTQGGLVSGEMLTAGATVGLDERYGVYGDGADRLPASPASVQLVFTE
jgi:hypothetical protein